MTNTLDTGILDNQGIFDADEFGIIAFSVPALVIKKKIMS